MSDDDVQAQEEKLRKYFNQLKAKVHTLTHTLMRLLKTSHSVLFVQFIHNLPF